MKKTKLDVNLWKAFERVKNRVKHGSGTVSLSEATSLINANVSQTAQVTEFQVSGLIDKQILDGQKIVNGKDIKGRNISIYEVSKSDVLNFIDLMKAFDLFKELGIVDEKSHPDNNSKIIQYYVPLVQYRNRITETETKATIAMTLLKNKFIQELMHELSKM